MCVRAVSTEKCVSVCQWLIAVLAQQLWGSRPHRDVSVAMETVGRRRGLGRNEEREKGQVRDGDRHMGRGKILHSCLCIFIHCLCVGSWVSVCVCPVSSCRVNKLICCRGTERIRKVVCPKSLTFKFKREITFNCVCVFCCVSLIVYLCLCVVLTIWAELIPHAQFSLKQTTWSRKTNTVLTVTQSKNPS